ncbi:MAG: penicillin-binding protein [Prevotella sp.]|nr:penicillin-binding protein [Prevotella sp.]
MKGKRTLLGIALMLVGILPAKTQSLPTDGPLTVRPLLQNLGTRLLKGKTGSIVAIRPETGEIICLCTNSPTGPNTALAIGKAYAPGSTFKTAQALTLLSEGLVTEETTIECQGAFTDGNIRVGCHKHSSPLNLRQALAYSCNTWFLSTFMSMLNDGFVYDNKEEAVTTWHDYMTSMGMGGPMGIDMKDEKGGLVANVNYLNRRYKNAWDARTILWNGMGQGDITLTPLQLCNLAVTIANRGFFYTPHIHAATQQRPLADRYKRKRQTRVAAEAYGPVIRGMRLAVEHGTCADINTAYPICGKTGTVENGGRDHSAFIGFAPMNEPKVAIAVYIEHGGFGSDMAAPIAALIMEEYLKGKLSTTSEAKAKRIENQKTR